MENNSVMQTYFQIKDVAERNRILKRLLCDMPVDAKDFFLKVFKKERYLDMKLSAVRGYAAYATEEEVGALMDKMLELLKKVPQKTPYGSETPSLRSLFPKCTHLSHSTNTQCRLRHGKIPPALISLYLFRFGSRNF